MIIWQYLPYNGAWKHDLRWTDAYAKYLKGQNVRWKKVMLIEDRMFVLKDGHSDSDSDAFLYVDAYGVPCNKEQSSLAAFEALLRSDERFELGGFSALAE